MKKFLEYFALLIIFAGALFLRIYKLTDVPPSLNWDEVAAGYNAYTIANWGADEYGNKFPVVFKSFGDDKHPVHIYIDALFVKAFGSTDFMTRLPSAIFGGLTVLAIYFLTKEMFKSKLAGFLSSIFLAVSPYHLQFSRGLWEANFAVAFYIFGLLLFYLGIRKKSWLLPISILNFGISFFAYHSSKILVPGTLAILFVLYFKEITKKKAAFAASVFVFLVFTVITIANPRILGFARIEQNKIQEKDIESTVLYGKTKSKYLAIAEITFNHYKPYFDPKYLFVSGDTNPRNSVNEFGQFYKIDALLIVIGLVTLLLKRTRESLVLFLWILLAPIPAAFAGGPQNAVRACFMMGSVNILAALGADKLIKLFKHKIWYVIALIIIFAPLIFEFGSYLKYYYSKYGRKNAIEWQYGMKQIVDYLKSDPYYVQVYMDKMRQQPYIFFLYYFKTPLPELLQTVKYDQSESKSYNTVVSYDKYQFGGNWNIINSYPNYGVLYIMTPSFYSGLMYRTDFEVKSLIKYPNGTDAFYIVGGNK